MSFDIPNANALEELAGLRQWVCWRMEGRGGKTTKIPVSPVTGSPASTTSSNTWDTFDNACSEVIQMKKCKTQLDGVGFVFTEGDHYVGIDLDKCIDDEGVLEPWARKIVTDFNSYTEFSPSGKGLHIYVKANTNSGGRRSGHLEVYSSARYFTVTGRTFEKYDVPIRETQEEMDYLFRQHFATEKNRRTEEPIKCDIDLDASPPLEKFMALATNNPKFKKTWDHSRTDLKDQSMSGYDLALVTLAAYAGWTDEELISLIVAHRRKNGDLKKAGRPDYIQRQLQVARASVREGKDEKESQKLVSILAAKDSGREDILAEISSHLGVTISGIVKRGEEDNSLYYFIFKDRELLIGGSKILFCVHDVRQKIMDATLEVMPSTKHSTWLEVCKLFKLVIHTDTEFHLTRPVETGEMLQDYIEEVTLYSSDEWSDAVCSGDPFERDGNLWVRTKEVLRFLGNSPSFGVKIASRELTIRLRELGFVKKSFYAREKSGKSLHRNYWGVAKEKLIDEASMEGMQSD